MIVGAAQAGGYARKGEHPVPSIDVHLAAGTAALNIMVAHFTSYNRQSRAILSTKQRAFAGTL